MTIKQAVIVLSLVTCLVTPSAQAMMHPQYYKEAREAAPYHLQIEVSKVRPKLKHNGLGSCWINGFVKRIFRQDPAKVVEVNTPIQFAASCHSPNAEVPTGGTLWHTTDDLKKARFMEVFLAPTQISGIYQSPLDQNQVIPSLSDTPQCPASHDGFLCP